MLLIGSSTLFSCSNNEDELPPKEQEQTNQETYTISFNLGGEYISTSETPLSRTEVTPKKIYGINVYYMDEGSTRYQNYAYGLFDNIKDMTISLIGGYKYKFECSMVQGDVDTLYHKGNTYYAPFHIGRDTGTHPDYRGTGLTNKFSISTRDITNIIGLKYGETSTLNIRYDDRTPYPKVDRFYGELTDYIPTKDGVANIDLKRTAFGLKFIVTPPADGTLFIGANANHSIYYYENEINPDIKVSAHDDTLESSSIYTFYKVYECWQAANYTEDITIWLTWKRANGATQTFEKTITIKRNVLTTVNVNVSGSSTDSSLGIKEDDTPMENEDVDINVDGGDLDDNEVNPNV